MVDYPRTFELATADSLTSLLAAPYFRHLLHEELLPAAKRGGDPLTIFHFDIDDFHGINTNHGHECGDAVLRAIAAALREAMPEGAVLSRYSGDEFAGALPDTRLDDAFTLAEEFRRRVVALRLERWPELCVACSIGLAAYPGNGGD